MKKLKVMADNTLLLTTFWEQLININNSADIVRAIILGICCLIKLISSVKDFNSADQYIANYQTVTSNFSYQYAKHFRGFYPYISRKSTYIHANRK